MNGTSFKPVIVDRGNPSLFETRYQTINYDIRWAVNAGPATQLARYNNGNTGLAVMDTDSKFFSIYSPKIETQSIVLSNNNYLTCMNIGSIKTSTNSIIIDNYQQIGELRTCWIGTNSIGGSGDIIVNKGLWHCDNSYSTASWLISNDDNSSGRTAVDPILNYNHIYTHVTAPMLMPNSPYGGNYFRFDGVDDSLVALNAWQNDSNTVSGNISMRWLDLPPTNDNFHGILVSRPWRLYLINDGLGNGKLWFMVENTNGNDYTKLESAVTLNSNVWYDINFEVNNNTVMLINFFVP